MQDRDCSERQSRGDSRDITIEMWEERYKGDYSKEPSLMWIAAREEKMTAVGNSKDTTVIEGWAIVRILQ